MKRLILVGLGLGVHVVVGKAFNNANAKTKLETPNGNLSDGPKLKDYQSELKKLFAGTDRVVERTFLPRSSGGTTFTGLVNRLLGESLHSEHESIDVRRFIYEAYRGQELLGLAHGSEYQNGSHPKIRVDVFYDVNGVIKDMRLSGVPDAVLKKFYSSGSLAQFIGRKPEDFEIKRNRRGRISKKGDFLAVQKFPTDAEGRKYYEAVVRSVRFNAAFMDVAFFITQHPNLDNDSQRLRVSASDSGPEAYVSSTRMIENPEDGSMLLMNGQKVDKN